MGNQSSAVACGAPHVTANPRNAKLSERDVKGLYHLYGHDDELLQLMCAAELLRDCVKNVRDSANAYFTAMTTAAKREREFGEKLEATANRQHSSGMTGVPAKSGDSDGDGEREGDDEGEGKDEGGDGGGKAAAPDPGGESKRAIGSSSKQEPHLEKVLQVQSLLGGAMFFSALHCAERKRLHILYCVYTHIQLPTR